MINLLARIIQGEAAPCDAAMVMVARCLAECIRRGDDCETTNRRWNGKREPTERARELAAGVLDGSIEPNGCYYCMSQTDVDTNGWVDGDIVVRCGIYANHGYREWPRKRATMEYPKPANGSKRGVHWNASNYPLFNNYQWFVNECRLMKMGWIKMLSDGNASAGQGDSGLELARAIQDAGMIPVVRFYCDAGHRWTDANSNAVDAYVRAGVRYIETINEPDLAYEWDGGNQPPNWAEVSFNNWIGHARAIIDHGGIPLSPSLASGFMQQRGEGAGQLTINPFIMVKDAGIPYFVCSIHDYQLNHPWDYPNDDVNQNGTPLTAEEYERWGGPWAWDGQSLGQINEWRASDKNPGDTIYQDDACFRAAEIFRDMLVEAGYPDVPILTTEGGWAGCLTDRQDRRYPRVTPQWQQYQAEKCLAYMADKPWFLGGCPWLAGQWKMGGHSGWEANAWYTDMHNEIFGLSGVIPLVQWLKDRPLSADGVPPQPDPDPDPEPPTPDPDPDPPLPEVAWSLPAWNEAQLVAVDAGPGEWYWRLEAAELTPDNMANTVWVDANGGRVFVLNANGVVEELPHKEPPELPNRPIWKQDRLEVWIDDGQHRSDRVRDIHTAYWDIPNVNTYHLGYLLRFRLVQEPAEPEPGPDPEPGEITDEDIRRAAWDYWDVPYNPDAAFPVYARAHGLGVPLTHEFDLNDTVRAQGYAGGIVYATIGDWANIHKLEW